MKISTVRKTGVLPPGLDYQALFEAGLDRAQKVSSDIWTDYNRHDPGVTILEQLCFALTDVIYRTSHPIEDLLETPLPVTDDEVLVPGEGDRVPQNFPRADEIFVTTPITRDDLQRYACDVSKDIRCAWIVQPSNCDGESPDAGLYDVEVMLEPRLYPPEDDAPDPKEMEQKVRKELRAVRSLGEDIGEVRVVEPNLQRLRATIESDQQNIADLDRSDLLARIIHHVADAINPPFQFEDTLARVESGVALDDLFDGPNFTRGTPGGSLHREKQTKVTENEIRALIMQVEGVKRVDFVKLPDAIEQTEKPWALDTNYTDGITVQTRDNAIRNRYGPIGTTSARLATSDGTRGDPNAVEAKLHINLSVEHRQEMARDELQPVLRDAAVPEVLTPAPGKRRAEIGAYRSIQHTFPGIYGLSEYDIPSIVDQGLPSGEEVAQLKGYLMLFEQQIANLLSQIAHMPKLLSARPHSCHGQFSGNLLSVKGPRGGPRDSASGTVDLLAHLVDGKCKETSEVEPCYLKRLTEIAETREQATRRVERKLDHLAARFNEVFPDNAIDDDLSTPLDNWLSDRDMRIAQKREFINDYARLSESRAGAGLMNDVDEKEDAYKTHVAECIRLQAGLTHAPIVVEHIMLRQLEEDPSVKKREVFGVGLADQENPLSVIAPETFGAEPTSLEDIISQLPEVKKVRLRNADSSAVRVFFVGESDDAVCLELLNTFPNQDKALEQATKIKNAIAEAQAGNKNALRKKYWPPHEFKERRLSVVFCDDQVPNAQRVIVERVAGEALPAHLPSEFYWDLGDGDLRLLKRFAQCQHGKVPDRLLGDVAGVLSKAYHARRVSLWP